jgi:hypothetical protein
MSRRLKPLINDFPRKLSRIEIDKIKSMMKRNLAASPSLDQKISQPQSSHPTPSDKTELIYSNLNTWPVHVGLRSLCEVPLVHAEVDKFMTRVFSLSNLDHETTVAVLQLMLRMDDKVSARAREILNRLILERELEEFSDDHILVVVDAVLRFGVSEDAMNRLVNHCADQFHTIALLRLNKTSTRTRGESVFPEILIPTLSKTELVDLLESVQECEIPQIIAQTVDAVSDQICRLSFHRLVEDKDRVLKILFKLKLKLDRLIYVENNPFYSKNSFLKSKIFRSISSQFHDQVISLPMSQVAEKMLFLNGVNSLRIDSVDIVSNRIQSFGDHLLGNLDGGELTGLLYAISHHPSAWKRKDKYRQQIASVVARALKAKVDSLSQTQLVSCVESVMLYHNSAIRSVVANEIVGRIDMTQIESVDDKIRLGEIFVKLQAEDPVLVALGRLFESLDPPSLTTPNIVDFFEIFGKTKLVGPCKILMLCLETRLTNSGGLISPTNIARVFATMASLQLRDSRSLQQTLLVSLGDVSSLQPRLLARIVSDIGLVSLADPTIHTTWLENALVALGDPDNFNSIVSDSTIATKFASAVPLLGSTGQTYTNHLATVPGNLLSSLLSVAKLTTRPHIEKEDSNGLLPKSTSFIGDILGALCETIETQDTETGGFVLETRRVWRSQARNLQVTIVRAKDCARDDSKHILARAALDIARDRAQGWRVVVLSETVIEELIATCPTESLRKRIRRARVVHGKVQDDFDRLVIQLKEIFTS